ncbi:MAG: recombination regulator RecX [Burkholderiales bacterium]|nr:recombination regulator RecX [Burkholderiales bacterium]
MAKPQISLKARALRYLAAREHSRLELARKLARYAQETDDVNALLDFLEAKKYLSQERFSESLVNRRAARFGNSRIMSELQSHGIKRESLVNLQANLMENEEARAREVWLRKFGREPADAAERAKQVRFLQQRGFSHRAIRAAMQNSIEDSDECGAQ